MLFLSERDKVIKKLFKGLFTVYNTASERNSITSTPIKQSNNYELPRG